MMAKMNRMHQKTKMSIMRQYEECQKNVLSLQFLFNKSWKIVNTTNSRYWQDYITLSMTKYSELQNQRAVSFQHCTE